jgi:hypothetical protein
VLTGIRAGTRRKYIHVGSSAASMPPKVPTRMPAITQPSLSAEPVAESARTPRGSACHADSTMR